MNKRVYELAKEFGLESKDVIRRLREAGIEVKDHLTPLSKENEEKARKLFEMPRPGEVEVKKLEGGRVVRRRAAAPPPTPSPSTQPPPTSPSPQVSLPSVAPVPPVDVQPPISPVITSAPIPSEVWETVSQVEKEIPYVEEKLPEPVISQKEEKELDIQAKAQTEVEEKIEPEKKEEEIKAAEEHISPPETTKPQKDQTVETSVEEVEEKPKVSVTSATKSMESSKYTQAIKEMAEKPDRKVKSQRLVYDRRRDVISLREYLLMYSADELEPAEIKPRVKKKKTAQRGKKPQKTVLTVPKEQKRIIKVEADAIQVAELAHQMGVKATDLVKKLISMGAMVSVTQSIDLDTAGIVASEYGYTVEKVGFDPTELLKEVPDGELELEPRPPVVTIMGHVDHGKTTLLDRIRKSRVAESEAGGITQHIGAYKVKTPQGVIVFLDTPGHEAFTAMRARGAKVTDIVILVVAADDGVMAQTLEAIAHARDANVPIVVAINKIDKPEARPERVKKELAEQGLIPEEWGGDTIFCEVSAKQGKGIENLLEMVLLQAQMLELKANPNKPGRGVVIEAFLDRQVGPTATVLVQSGTVKVGDVVIAGLAHGHVRTMTDDLGKPLSKAGPSTPVRISGLNMVPNAGDTFVVVPDEEKAKKIAQWQMEKAKEARAARSQSRVTLEDFHRMVELGNTKELRLILRADVQGSLGALTDAITKLSKKEITIKIIHSAVGNITESDVNLAIASNAVIVGFNVNIDPKASALAEQEQVDVRRYSIIYDLIDDIGKAMEGMLAPKVVKRFGGKAEVRQVFNISKIGKVAGVFVVTGRILRSAEVRVIRDKKTIFEGKLSSLKRFKDDQREVKQGFECGVGIEGFQDIEVGDILEFYETETVRPGE